MSLLERLQEDMKTAMRDREEGKLRLSVIRMVKAAVKYSEIDKQRALSEEEVLGVVSREVKQRRDSIPDFQKANRADLVDVLHQEIAILLEYLPTQLSADEIRQIVGDAIQEVGARNPNDLGKVMKVVMPKTKGRSDGNLVNTIVREMLG